MALDSILNAMGTQIGQPRMVELGKIKIGGKGKEVTSQSGKKFRMPRKDDFFTITGLARNAQGDLIPDEALMASLIAEYGDSDKKLRQIPIRVLSDDIDEILTARFCWYGRKACGATSDGDTVTWRYDPQTMQPLNPPRVEKWRPELLDLKDKSGAPIFKLHSNFACSIYSQKGRWGGVYLFRTTSVISFRQLYASLVEVSDKTGGILTGMPLMLVVRPMLVTPDGKPTNVYVCHVELRGKDLQELQKLALEQAQFRIAFKGNIERAKTRYQKLLVAPGEESDEEAAEIADEFVPIEDAEIVEEPDLTVPANIHDTTAQLADLLAGDVGQRAVGDKPEVEPAKPAAIGPEMVEQFPPQTDEQTEFEAPGSEQDESEGEEAQEADETAEASEAAQGEPEPASEPAAVEEDQRAMEWKATLEAIESATTQEAITGFAGAFRNAWGLSGDEATQLTAAVRVAWARVSQPAPAQEQAKPTGKGRRKPSPPQSLPGM